MNETYFQLETLVPFEITSRYLAAFFEVNSKKCSDYVNLAVTDITRQDAICTTFDFSKLDDVKTFLAATYYGGDYLTTLQTKTTMTDDEIALFFSATDPESFQTAYLN